MSSAATNSSGGGRQRRSMTSKVALGGCLVLIALGVFVACVGALGIAASGPPATDEGHTAPAATETAPVLVDGTWTAGVDVPAGTWRSRGVPTDGPAPGCIWSIARDGEPIDGGATEAGYPTLRLAAGEEVSLTGCGTWDMQQP